MIRTQISLDPEEYALVKREAKSLGISIAEFVRRAIRQGLPPRGRAQAPWMRYAGLVESGNPRSSQTVDGSSRYASSPAIGICEASGIGANGPHS